MIEWKCWLVIYDGHCCLPVQYLPISDSDSNKVGQPA